MSILERMVRAVEKVRDRLRRVSSALNAVNVDYAVVGGNAVAAWVATVDEAAVRNTQDVDILLRRSDLDLVKFQLAERGFIFRHAAGIDMFLDGPSAKARDSVHVVFANEKIRPEYAEPTPSVTESRKLGDITFLELEGLVRMKLTSFRDKDRMHLRDLIGVGLVDNTWPNRFSPPLRIRLESILDDPEG